MYTQKQWIYPTLFGEHSYYKPPAAHWLLLGSWNLFGLSFGAAVLPFALTLFLSALTLARIAGNPLAALLLVGNVASLMFGFTTQMEVLLLSCVVGLTWSLQRESWWSAWLFVGIAALVKSPSYSVLFGASVVLYSLLTRGWRSLGSRSFLLGASAALSLGMSWYLWVYTWDRQAFVAQYITREHLNKLHGNGIGFYPMTRDFLLLCVPIAFLLPLGLRRPERLMWVVGGPLLVFLLWTPYRMDAYLYPILPLLVWQALRFLPRMPKFLLVQGVAVALGVLVLLPLLYSSRIIELTGLVGLMVFALLYAWGSHPQRLRTLGWAAVLLIFTVRVSAQRLGEQDVAELRALARTHPTVEWRMYDGTHSIWNEVGFLSTALRKPITRVFSVEDACSAIKKGEWVIIDQNGARDVLPEIQKRLSVELHEWKRWKRGIDRLPLSQILSFRRTPLAEWSAANQKSFWIVSSQTPSAKTTE